jgi:hypothetical protein
MRALYENFGRNALRSPEPTTAFVVRQTPLTYFKQLIPRSVPASGFAVQRVESRQRSFLECQVRVQVDLRGFERFVPELKSNGGTINSSLQKAPWQRYA